jgi:2-polyprenyl-3-methyl-5-hydroxy-6-metoxy-1,4-benzoquinol methylase
MINNIKKYYDSKAEYYDILNKTSFSTANQEVKLLRKIFSKYKITPIKIFDIGCGTGRLSLPLSKLNYNVTGIDISKNELKIARIKAKILGLKINFYYSDVRTFKNKNIDVVVAGDGVICHIYTKIGIIKCFKNIFKNLNNNGIFIFDASNYDYKKITKKINRYHVKKDNKDLFMERKKHFTNDGLFEWTDSLKVYENKKCTIFKFHNKIVLRKNYEWIKLLKLSGFKNIRYYPRLYKKGIPRTFYYVGQK